MKPGDLVVVQEIEPNDTEFAGRIGTVTSVRRQLTEVGFLVLLEGETDSLYFGPQRLIAISDDTTAPPERGIK